MPKPRKNEGPALDPDHAIGLFRQQLSKDVENLAFDDPQVVRWWNTSENIVRGAFGADHPNVDEFTCTFSVAQTRHGLQQEHATAVRQKKGLLEAFIEQLQSMRPQLPNVPVAVEREGVYFAGQQFDAMVRVSKILSLATKSITIIDGYIGEDLLDLLSAKPSSVFVAILTRPLSPSLTVLAKAFNSQHGGLSIRSSLAFHDRFVIIDDADFYHFGASIKDLGKRAFMFSRIEEPEIIDGMRRKYQQEWGAAKVEI